MINLRHDRIAPVTEFFIGKRLMETDNRKRRVRQKLRRPIRTHRGTELPRLGWAVGSDPWLIALPFRLRVKDKPIGALLKNIVSNPDLGRHVSPKRAIVAEN